MIGDGAREGILRVGVDVHLDDTVAERLTDLFERRSRAAMEHEVHFSFGSVLVGDCFLTILEDRWLELDRAGLVAAVDVAEGGGEHEATNAVEGLVDSEHVLGRGVQFVRGHAGGVVSVFLTTDDACFDFEDDVQLHAFFEEGLGGGDILIERQFGTVEHVAVEEVAFSGRTTLRSCSEEWLEEFFDLVRVAVVCVEGNEDVVALGKAMHGLGQNNRAQGHVLDTGARGKFAAAGGDLDDSVRLRIRKGLQCAVDGRQRGDVDGGVCVTTLLGGVEHGGILGGCGNGHDGSLGLIRNRFRFSKNRAGK